MAKFDRFRLSVLVLPCNASDSDVSWLGMQRHDDIVANCDLIREPPELARPVGYHIVGVVGVGRFERKADAVTCVVATDIAQPWPADESEALGEGSLLSFAFFAASLGLGVVTSLLESCGGSLEVEAPADGGALVRLVIPAGPAPAAAADRPPTSQVST